jgi:hypothetical protein
VIGLICLTIALLTITYACVGGTIAVAPPVARTPSSSVYDLIGRLRLSLVRLLNKISRPRPTDRCCNPLHLAVQNFEQFSNSPLKSRLFDEKILFVIKTRDLVPLANLQPVARWLPRQWDVVLSGQLIRRHLFSLLFGLIRQQRRRKGMSQFWSPLYLLIERRRRELGLRKGELASRCGCINPEKGIPWIDAIAGGQIDHPRAREIMKELPGALEIEQEEFDQVLTITRQQINEREQEEEAKREAAWRASFEPHGYLTTESTRPSQIVIMGLTGGPDRWLRINLDLDRPPLTFVGQAHEVASKTKSVPFFGRVTGFVVNYSPDEAVKFDLEGNPLAVLHRAYSPGQASIIHRGRHIDGPLYARIIGLSGASDSHTASKSL